MEVEVNFMNSLKFNILTFLMETKCGQFYPEGLRIKKGLAFVWCRET